MTDSTPATAAERHRHKWEVAQQSVRGGFIVGTVEVCACGAERTTTVEGDAT